jgi:integrase
MTKRPTLRVGEVRLRAVAGPDMDGRFRWRAEWYEGKAAKQRTRALGWATPRDALDKAERFTRDAPMGPAAGQEVITLRDLLSRHMGAYQKRADLSPVTRRNRVCNARRLARELGAVRVERFNIGVLEDYRDRMLRAGLSTGTVLLDKKVLGEAWEYGRRMGWTPDRPMPKLKLKHKAVREKYTPTPAEVRAMASYMEEPHRTGFILLASTGCRIGEVVGLTWDRVDLDGGWLVVEGKTGRRDVPIMGGLGHVLEEHHRQVGSATVGHIFGKPVNADKAIRLAIARACRKLGVTHFSPNGLRRYAVDEMARAGVDPYNAAAFTGHSPSVMMRYYRQATREDLRSVAKSAGLGLLTGSTQVLKLPDRRGKG